MLKIGVTGGLGAGKTTVAKIFAEHGAPIIDTDEISHELTAQNGAAIPAIHKAFGEAVFKSDGILDRQTLRARMLEADSARQQLESILHPLIRGEVIRRLAVVEAPYVLVVVPLLVETGTYDSMLDRVLVVDCSEETQVRRALARGGWGEAEIRAMLARQAGRKIRQSRADDIIDTDCSLAELADRVASMHKKYLELAGQTL